MHDAVDEAVVHGLLRRVPAVAQRILGDPLERLPGELGRDAEHDVARRDRADDAEWRELIVVSRGLYVEPRSTLDRVARALRSRGVPVPSTYDPEWMRHFPGRRSGS